MNNYRYACHYNRCWLPRDNSKYLWQVFFLAVSVILLFKKMEDFSFFPIFLFISPVMVDIITTELKSKVCTFIRWLFGIGNAVIFILCILGFAGIIVDEGNCFALVSTFIFFKKISVEKTFVGIALTLEILVPIVFFIGAPSQKTLHMLEVDSKITERKGAKSK